MLNIFEMIVFDEGRYYRFRADDPTNPYHELSLKQVMELERHLTRYEEDWAKEHVPDIV